MIVNNESKRSNKLVLSSISIADDHFGGIPILAIRSIAIRPSRNNGHFFYYVGFNCNWCSKHIYQGIFPVKIWPLLNVKDQVVVTHSGDVFVSMTDPVGGLAERIQRYNCDGKFIAAYQPNNAGGVFKFLVTPDRRLEIYSVRTRSIDVFTFDGSYIEQRTFGRGDVSFEFLKSGPSITKTNGCEFIHRSASGRPAVRNQTGVWGFENGDWILEYIFSRKNVSLAAIFGAVLFICGYVKYQRK